MVSFLKDKVYFKSYKRVLFFVVVTTTVLLSLPLMEGKFVKKNMEISVLLTPFNVDSTLDPSFLRYTTEYHYLQSLMINLVEIDGKENYKNQLAESIEKSSDGSEFRIKIKEAYFSNGDRITIEDVVKSIKRAIILGTPHFKGADVFRDADKLKSIDDEIAGVQVVSKSELILRFNHSTKEALYYLQLTDLGILHSSQYKKDRLQVKDWTEVTSGPYRAKIEDGKMAFVANQAALNYSEDMPQKIFFQSTSDIEELSKKIQAGDLHLGELRPMVYLKLQEKVKNIDGFKLFGSKNDGITALSLNAKSKVFKNESTRRWVLKRVLDSYEVPESTKGISEKAYQFFLPQAKGYVANAKIYELLENVDTQKVPDELKDGFSIETVTGMENYLLPGLERSLSDILGVNVSLKADMNGAEYENVLKTQKHEALTITISMSYKVLGETLNFQYLNETPFFQDPTGRVKELLKKYQSLDEPDQESLVIKDILKQMTLDAECIPLYYVSMPTFFRSDKIEVSDIYLDEAIQFWRIRVK